MRDCVLTQTAWNRFNAVVTEVGVGPRLSNSLYSSAQCVANSIVLQSIVLFLVFWWISGAGRNAGTMKRIELYFLSSSFPMSAASSKGDLILSRVVLIP